MRVLLVHDYGRPVSGAELQMIALRDGLRQRGHEVLLFGTRASPVSGLPLVADVNCAGSAGRVQALAQVVNPSAFVSLRRVLLDFRPDVVHVRMFLWQLSTAIMPLLRNVPSLYHACVYKSICPRGTKLLPDAQLCEEDAGLACLKHGCVTPQTWVALMLQLRLFHHWRGVFDRVVALSARMRDVLERCGIGPVQVVHNGIAIRPARPPLSGPPLIAYAGRLAPEKGIDALLRAFAELGARCPQARLLLAGDGPQRSELERLSLDLGLQARTTFLGHVDHDEMERAFAPAWIQVVPSLWDEPFGNVTLEGMARGTAVVATRVGASPEIIDHGRTGFLVAPGNVHELAAVFERLVCNRELAEAIGTCARAEVQRRFSFERMIDRFLAIYGDMTVPGPRHEGTSVAT